MTALCIFDTLRGGSAARRSRPLIRRSLFRRSSTIRVAMLRRRRRSCWRAGVPAPCLACVLSRPSKTAPALDSLRSLLASSPCLVALASWFRAVRVPPRRRNRLLAIVSNLFYSIRHSQHSTCRRLNIAIWLAIGDGVAANVHSLFSPQRISRSESGLGTNFCYDDENNISYALVAVLRDASPRQSDVAKGGEAFRGLESDGKNGGCDPISTRRHSIPKRKAWTVRDGME